MPSSITGLSDCKVCQDIWCFFTQPDSVGMIDLDSFSDAISTGCRVHKPLIEAFKQYCHTVKRKDVWEEPESLRIFKRAPGSITLEWSFGMTYSWSVRLSRQHSNSDVARTGRILDPAWVNVNLIKIWKQNCLDTHGAKCDNPMKVWAARPDWLIDVKNRCIVPGNDNNKPYIALSYRWNKKFNLKIHKDEVYKYFPPNSLDDKNVSGLAPTIKHAMRLTDYIGERYLWVDALCIVHGDWDSTSGQLSLMGAIYANASITIIATDDDAELGIVGLRGISGPRSVKQAPIPFGEERIVVQSSDWLNDGNSSYYSRAWTYQEYHMSRRRLLFSEGIAHWECESGVWHEEMVEDQPGNKLHRETDFTVFSAGLPDLRSLDLCIHWYCTRDLTYEEDNLSAISGLLSIASRAFPGGFLYGLAEMHFERGLCWYPHFSDADERSDLRRRKESNRPFEDRVSHFKLPSWSWIGWQGRISFGGYAERTEWHNLTETSPTTEWYTSNSPTGASKRRIQSTWYKDRERYKNPDTPLPSGWTRHEGAPEQTFGHDIDLLWPEGCGGYYFEHKDMPEFHGRSWYYPFPVADIDIKTPAQNSEQTPYLFCQTKRAYVMAYSENHDNKNVILQDGTGRNIGDLYLHNRDQLRQFPIIEGNESMGKRIEVVEICRQQKGWRGWDEEKRMWVAGPFFGDYISVLWIEWEKEIAYRLASGQVKKAEWEELELEYISLVLG